MAGIIPGNALAEVVADLSAEAPPLTRLRWSGGALNATGEREGAVRSEMTFAGLVTRGDTRQARRAWGELAPQEALILTTVDAVGGLSGLLVGDVVVYRGKRLEVKEVRAPDLHAERPFMRALCREVQDDGQE